MQVDFYQLAGMPIEKVVPQLAGKVIDFGERLLLVTEDDRLREFLDTVLWTDKADSFLPHGEVGEGNEDRQPILLSQHTDPANGAKFIMLADGKWRDEALSFERALYLFDNTGINDARAAWRNLSTEDDIEPRYWKNENGRWREGP